MGLTGFVIIHVFIASFSPVQGERNQMVNTKFTRPVNEMPMSTTKLLFCRRLRIDIGISLTGPVNFVFTIRLRSPCAGENDAMNT